jgi:hypothetical protein
MVSRLASTCVIGGFNCTQGTAIVFGHFGYTNFLIDPFAIVVNDHVSARNKSQSVHLYPQSVCFFWFPGWLGRASYV